MKKLCFILWICLLLSGCGSASSDYAYKDDLSDVIVKDYDDSDPTSFPNPISNMEKDKMVYGDGEFEDRELGQDNHKRYFVYFVIYNDMALNEAGNWTPKVDTKGYKLPLSEDDYDIGVLKSVVDDFEQYCKDHDIPYVMDDYNRRWSSFYLCISPKQFFEYEFPPQATYNINHIISDTREQLNKFLENIKNGKRMFDHNLTEQGYPYQDLQKNVILVEDFDKELNRVDLSLEKEEEDTELYKSYPQHSTSSFDGEEENVRGVFTNYKEYGVSADEHKQYFVSLEINNDLALDEEGYLSPITEPDPKMLKNALEDFEKYCTDNDIPYVIYEYGKYNAWMYLCISPAQFFAYEFLPQVSYDIGFVPSFSQQRFDMFLRHIKKGEIRLYEMERYKKK